MLVVYLVILVAYLAIDRCMSLDLCARWLTLNIVLRLVGVGIVNRSVTLR